MQISLEQEEAMEMCANTKIRICAVTGGPGTGKTTILKHSYEYLKNELEYPHEVAFIAPTGRAAKRITEATGVPAKTIHRILEFPIPTEVEKGDNTIVFGQPRRNSARPLTQKLIFVDESSMIPPKLYEQLMDALPNDGSIRFFGDINQLPPVQFDGIIKSPFKNVLDTYPNMELTRNYRSDDNLAENAHRILKGRMPVRGEKFDMILTSDTTGALREIVTNEYKDPEHQILTPMRKGKAGAVRLSAMLRTMYNPRGDTPRLQLPRFNDEEDVLTVLLGDKALWTKNDYYINVMNGETGVLTKLDQFDGDMELALDDRTVHVPAIKKGFMGQFYDPRRAVDLAYVMTTHKAQGSEFETVIYVLNHAQMWMTNRNNLYTGVTRAKRKMILIADRGALFKSLRKAITW